MSDTRAEMVPTEPAPTAANDTQPDAAPAEPETDLAAELEKWKTRSRKNEDRAKANAEAAKELERLKREALPEQERMIEEARAKARAEALAEVGADRVDDAVKLAAAGRPVDADALLEGLDRGKFIGENGQPDHAAISAWVDRVAPKQETPSLAADLGQGARTSTNAGAIPLNSPQLLSDLKAAVGAR